MNKSQDEIDRENVLVLVAVQASLGLIGPTVKAVALEFTDPIEVKLQVWATDDMDAVNEDAVDMFTDMEAMLGPEMPSMVLQVLDRDPGKATENWTGRYIYFAKLDSLSVDQDSVNDGVSPK